MDKEYRQLLKDIKAILAQVDLKRYSVLEYAARRYVSSLKLDLYTSSNWESLNSKIRGFSEDAARISKLETLTFFFIAGIHFGVAKSISYGGVEVIASDSVLTVLLLVFSFFNFQGYLIDQNATMLRIAAKTVLTERGDLDPSGAWVAESDARRKTPLNYLLDMLNSEIPTFSFQFAIFVLFSIFLLLVYLTLTLLIPYIVIASSLYLAESGAWTFQYKALFFLSCSSLFARLFAVSIEGSIRFKLGGGARRLKFWKDVKKYDLAGAVNILRDDVREELLRTKIEMARRDKRK